MGCTHLGILCSQLPPNTPLTQVDLSQQGLTGEACEVLLEHAAALPRLSSLNLSFNPLGPYPDSADNIAALPCGRGGWSLTDLSLLHTMLCVEATTALTDAIAGAPALTRLDISYNPLIGAEDPSEVLGRLKAAWSMVGKAEIDLKL